MFGADCALASSSESNSASWSFQDDVEIHAEDTSEGIILNSQIDVFLDTETEVSSGGEVLLFEFSVLDFQSSFENFISFISSYGNMNGNFLISFNAETSDGESSS